MASEFKLPDIGEGLAEGEIVKWLVSVGDHVEEDAPLVEVMTDKATVEIPSPRSGHILELRANEGQVVEVGTTIVIFGEPGEEPAGQPAQSPEPGSASQEERVETATATPISSTGGRPTREPEEVQASGLGGSAEVSADALAEARERARAERAAAETEAVTTPAGLPAAAGRVLATPATRRLARELSVDIRQVAGSGVDGRVMKEDVRAVAEAGPAPPPPAPAPAPATPAAAPPTRSPDVALHQGSVAAATTAGEERVPLRGLRRTIAERMVRAKTIVPHYTYVEEVDMTEVVLLREEAKAMAAERGVKLTYLPFIIRALVLALKRHPYMNASLDEEAGEIVLKRYYNVGIATATDNGLIVPVIKAADQRGVFELAAEIHRLAAAARDGSIELEDLRGGTITISSTGNLGGVLATPIINLPEVAILGVTAIRKRPMVYSDQIVARHMLNLSLSLDHRVVDGAVGAIFMQDLVKLLEDPKLQLLGGL
ncbi:MAG: dihydrolipoamide acetyltransferase family protein [Acidobacteriota bacterium]